MASGIGWAITGVIYLVLICTLCILGFRKGTGFSA